MNNGTIHLEDTHPRWVDVQNHIFETTNNETLSKSLSKAHSIEFIPGSNHPNPIVEEYDWVEDED